MPADTSMITDIGGKGAHNHHHIPPIPPIPLLNREVGSGGHPIAYSYASYIIIIQLF